ncbi:MAG: hypothetical protein WBG64_03225, partial [Thermoanaerobaculia bacterium]
MKTESSAILLICLAFACPRGLGGQVEEDIAPHPRALTFGQVSVALPSAEGRAVQLDTGPLVFLAADHTLP